MHEDGAPFTPILLQLQVKFNKYGTHIMHRRVI